MDGVALPSTAATTPSERKALWVCLGAFVVAGVVTRAAIAVLWPTVHRPDEIFQTLEPAHLLWTGWGVMSWEWRDGIRSWLFPGFLAGLMELTTLLHLPAKAALPVIWSALSVVASGVVAIGVWLGWRRRGLIGAVLCGTLCAFWPDLVYFGPKTLAEVQSGNLLVVAAGLASLAPAPDTSRSWRRLAAIGLLLGLTFDLRFQLAPAAALVAVWAVREDWRRDGLPLVLAALVSVAAMGVLDAWTWGSPFQSVWKNVAINLFEGKADSFGTLPASAYVGGLLEANGAASVPLFALFLLGWRDGKLLAAVAIVVVGFHSLIAHKEISFVYAALPCTMIVIGLGAARVVGWLPTRWRGTGLALSVVLSLVVMLSTPAPEWRATTPPERIALISLWGYLRAAPDLCGLGLYDRSYFHWTATSGYTGLNRAVPIYMIDSQAALPAALPAFNYAITLASSVADVTGFETVHCSDMYCLLHRAQPCRADPEQEISRELARINE